MRRPALLALALAACEQAPPSERTPPPTPIPDPVPVVPIDGGTVRPVYDSCSFIAIEMTPQGTWVGSPPDIRCFAPRLPNGEYDQPWLRNTLYGLYDVLSPVCLPPVELAGHEELPVAEINAAIVMAKAAQFKVMAFVLTPRGSMVFDPAAKAPRQCPPPTPGNPASVKVYDRSVPL